MPVAPPRFTLSPFDEGDDDRHHHHHQQNYNQHPRATNHKRPTPTNFQLSRRSSRGLSHAGPLGDADGNADPVHSSRRALGDAKLPASDLHNVNQLFAFLAALVGVLVAVALVQSGVNNALIAKLVQLPGDLYLRALLCVIVPTIFLNSILASMHFWTLNKAKALFYKLLAYFFVTTLYAAVLGMLVGVCAAPLFSVQRFASSATTGTAVTAGKAAIAVRCPTGRNASVVFRDNALRCEDATKTNATTFLLQDLSATFKLRTDPRTVLSLGTALATLLESFFPGNAAQSFLQGDVLSVILIGAALGIALIHKSTVRTREHTPGFRTPFEHGGNGTSIAPPGDAGQLFLLIMQCEVMLSVVLRVLLKALPFAFVPIVAGGILAAHAGETPPTQLPSIQDLVTLFAVVVVALLVQLATLVAATMMLTKSNPFAYTKHLLPAQLVALATSSSLVALPSTVRSIAASKQVSMPLAHFVCSTGLVLNKNGSALYLAVASVYVLVTSGLRDAAMDATHLVVLTVVSMLCSCVVPPMPRGNLALLATILSSVFGVHDTVQLASMVLFLTAMDWLLDPFVTAVNVTTNCLLAWILAVQMDESFIEFGRLDAVSDTQEEDSNDGFPLDESGHHHGPPNPQPVGSGRGPMQHQPQQHPTHQQQQYTRHRSDTHGSGTMRTPMVARTTSVGESVVSV